MTPEARAREQIDNRLRQSGWTIQDLKQLNLTVASGVAVREFPTNTGPVDYALFIEGAPVGVVEAKKDEEGQALTDVETQSSRYANSQFKWVKREYKVRFAYEATGELVRFTDYADLKYRSREVFSFHRPETLKRWLAEPDTVRNNLKRIPQLDASANVKSVQFMVWTLRSQKIGRVLLCRWQPAQARPLQPLLPPIGC